MKKILSICLVLLTSFALCACSSEEEKEANNQTKTEEKSMVLEKQQHIKKMVKNVFISL